MPAFLKLNDDCLLNLDSVAIVNRATAQNLDAINARAPEGAKPLLIGDIEILTVSREQLRLGPVAGDKLMRFLIGVSNTIPEDDKPTAPAENDQEAFRGRFLGETPGG